MGQLANDVRAALENALEACSKKLEAAALERRLRDEALDVHAKMTILLYFAGAKKHMLKIICSRDTDSRFSNRAAALERRLKDEALDVTIPGKPVALGHQHPMNALVDDHALHLMEHGGVGGVHLVLPVDPAGGLERTALRRFRIDDLRLIFENDVRFLEQF